jgi:hypothetical protein
MAVVDADLNIDRGIRRIVRTVALHVLRDNYRNSCVGVLKTMAKPNQQKNECARDGYRSAQSQSAQSQIAQFRCRYSHNRIHRADHLSPLKQPVADARDHPDTALLQRSSGASRIAVCITTIRHE